MILPPPITPSYRKDLYTMVSAWDNDPADALEPSRYKQMLDEVLFHGELRFAQYVPFRDDEGPFLRRLWSFLMNVPDERRRKSLLSLFQRLMFIDSRQMAALYKDAYRRVVIPWLTNAKHPHDRASFATLSIAPARRTRIVYYCLNHRKLLPTGFHARERPCRRAEGVCAN